VFEGLGFLAERQSGPANLISACAARLTQGASISTRRRHLRSLCANGGYDFPRLEAFALTRYR
jgi:hypothetical protein